MNCGFAVFDVDGTLIRGQSQNELVKFLYAKKYIGLKTLVTISFWFLLYRIGLVSDPKRVADYAFSFLAGKSVSEFNDLVADFFESKLKGMFYAEAVAAVKSHTTSGRDVILLSNAINPIIERVAAYLGVDDFICTRLEQSNGCYTGKMSGNPVFGPYKTPLLKSFIAAQGLNIADSWGYGDHLSDSDYLSVLAHPIAVNPVPGLKKFAEAKGWQIIWFKQ